MTVKTKVEPEIPPKPIPFAKQLLVAAIVIFIGAVIVLFVGKWIFAGVLALFGAVLGLGSQVGKSN